MFRFKLSESDSAIVTDLDRLLAPGEEFTLADSLAKGSKGIAALIGCGKLKIVNCDADEPLIIEDRYVTNDFKPNKYVAIQSEWEILKERQRKEESAPALSGGEFELSPSEAEPEPARIKRRK